MKKTIFTVCSILTVCTIVFLACTKDDNGKTQVSYSSQSSYGSGNNPNPNNYPSSSGYSTAGTTTGSTTTSTVTACTKSMTYDGAGCTSLTSSGSGNSVSLGSSCGSATMVFPGTGAPASGTYVIMVGSISGMQCNFTCGTVASGGVVTITTGSPNKATFSNIICGTHTVTGTACY